MNVSAGSRRYSPVWLSTISTFGCVLLEPGDEVVVAVGGRRRPEDALDLDDVARLAAEHRLGDVLGRRVPPISLLSAPMCWVTSVVDRAVQGDDRDAGVQRPLGGRRQRVRRQRRQQQHVDSAGDQVVDVGGLLVRRRPGRR